MKYEEKYETYASCLNCSWRGPASKIGDSDKCPRCKSEGQMIGYMVKKKEIK